MDEAKGWEDATQPWRQMTGDRVLRSFRRFFDWLTLLVAVDEDSSEARNQSDILSLSKQQRQRGVLSPMADCFCGIVERSKIAILVTRLDVSPRGASKLASDTHLASSFG